MILNSTDQQYVPIPFILMNYSNESTIWQWMNYSIKCDQLFNTKSIIRMSQQYGNKRIIQMSQQYGNKWILSKMY